METLYFYKHTLWHRLSQRWARLRVKCSRREERGEGKETEELKERGDKKSERGRGLDSEGERIWGLALNLFMALPAATPERSGNQQLNGRPQLKVTHLRTKIEDTTLCVGTHDSNLLSEAPSWMFPLLNNVNKDHFYTSGITTVLGGGPLRT